VRNVDEHLAHALSLVSPLPPVDLLIDAALGLVLAREVRAEEDQPRWDNSAMDGYAVRSADVAGTSAGAPVTLSVVGDAPAGGVARAAVEPGRAVRIMTGAPLPDGADAVVPVEDTDGGLTQVQVTAGAPAGRHIRRRGEDTRAGAAVLVAGTLLGAAQLAAAAAVGCGRLSVHRRPRVAVIATGAELVAPGEPLGPGQIPDSNSVLLAALVREAGCEPVARRSDDDPARLIALLGGLEPQVDAVITSGGVSKGAFDVVKAALRDEPGMTFVEVAMQPGKPQGLGRLAGGTPLFALPGNPVSVFVSFHVFVAPALARLRGMASYEQPTTTAEVAVGWGSPPGRAQHMPVRIQPRPGELAEVRPSARLGSGSHLVVGLAAADGLALVPAEVERVDPGDRVQVMRVVR